MRPDEIAPAEFIRPADLPLRPPLHGWARAKTWLAMLFPDHGIFRTVFNTRSRVADDMWRSSLPLPYQIASAARAGIKTVINLRGPSDGPSYRLEEEACRRYGLTLVNFGISSRMMPGPGTVAGAKAMFDKIEYPALMHCKSGADRVGLMAALYLLLQKGASVDEASKMLSLRYGHIRQAKTGLLDYFLDAYRTANEKSPVPFLEWATTYDHKALEAGFHAQWWATTLTDKLLRRE